MRTRRILAVALLVFSCLGCASVPKQTATLSTTIGSDIASLHRSHRELASRYFARIESDINSFVDETYRPYIIQTSMTGYALRKKLAEAENDTVAFEEMDIFVKLIVKDIEFMRDSLQRPVAAKRYEVITAIDESYQTVQQAQAVVTGYLSSAYDVHQTQKDILGRAGLEGLRDRFIQETAALSDKVANVVAKARQGNDTAAETQASLNELAKVVAGRSK